MELSQGPEVHIKGARRVITMRTLGHVRRSRRISWHG